MYGKPPPGWAPEPPERGCSEGDPIMFIAFAFIFGWFVYGGFRIAEAIFG